MVNGLLVIIDVVILAMPVNTDGRCLEVIDMDFFPAITPSAVKDACLHQNSIPPPLSP